MLNQKKLFLGLIMFILILNANAQQSTNAETVINLKGVGLQYDKVRFSVKPGEKIKLSLTNGDDMSHNLLITQPGAREEVVNAALKLGGDGAKANYVPPGGKVLWFIPLISPGETASLRFTAPASAGVYPFVCTFPGHGFVMYGAMYVGLEMPLQKDDMNIPESRRSEGAPTPAVSVPGTNMPQNHSMNTPHAAALSGHPYPLVPPFLFRAFLPDTGPDAIGVSLPNQLSYCWDGTTCRMRYAWQGGFLDFTDFWKSYKRFSVKVIGTVFYRDKTTHPLHFDQPNSKSEVKFKGYRLIARYPEFHYTLNGTDIYEFIVAKTDGTGLIRTFRIPNGTKPVWFIFDPTDGVDYSCEKGEWINGRLRLSPVEARKFSITMTKKEGVKL